MIRASLLLDVARVDRHWRRLGLVFFAADVACFLSCAAGAGGCLAPGPITQAQQANTARGTAVNQNALANVLTELQAWIDTRVDAAVGEATAKMTAAWNAVDARSTGGDVSGTKRTTTVGGGGDTVTEWMLVAGMVTISAGLAGGLLYGYVLRPLGLRAKSPAERAAERKDSATAR